MRVILVGAGAVGARAGRQLISVVTPDELVVVEHDNALRSTVVESLGEPAREGSDADSKNDSTEDSHGGASWNRTSDLILIRDAL